MKNGHFLTQIQSLLFFKCLKLTDILIQKLNSIIHLFLKANDLLENFIKVVILS